MTRLIDADALIEAIENERTYLINRGLNGMEDVIVHHMLPLVDNAPTIDAEPKHGEWEQHDGYVLCKDDDTYFYTCSCCKMAITEAERGLFNFCPNCGAKMDKEKNNG